MMTDIKLRWVHRFRDRHGKVRYYFRRDGKRVALPGLPGSREFMAAYDRALIGDKPPVAADRTVAGTMTALAVEWYDSARFKALSPAGQTNYRRIVERFLTDHGHRKVADMEGRHVARILDQRADTPTAANRLLSILRLMMRHAIKRGWRDDDPTRDVERVRHKSEGFPTWTEEDITMFEDRWPLGTRARLALALLLYTGQRRGDVIRMGRQHVRNNAIEVVQAKTGTRLAIPIHPHLSAAIDGMPGDNLTFLVTQAGAPFASGNAFYNWFQDCADKAGIEKGKSPHGLRKAAARRLAEAGCTPHEIMSITGHATLAEVERYTRAANKEGLARSAIARIGGEPNAR